MKRVFPFAAAVLLGMIGCAVGSVSAIPAIAAEQLTPRVTFHRGPINSVVIQGEDAGPGEGGRMVVYQAPGSSAAPRAADAEGDSGAAASDGGSAHELDYLLLCHGRRDAVEASREAAARADKVVAPAREQYALESGPDFWKTFTTTRFHDYAQQSTKVLAGPLRVTDWVKEGDTITWRDVKLRVLETTGFTRGSVSYVGTIDGKKMAFTGDLIYGDGQILDLYSFQDAIPEAQIRGYHGYGSRLAGLVEGLRKVAAEQPDLIVPARGPVIENPQEAIARLIRRVQAVYRNYLSTNALHWYFKEDRMTTCGRRVLGEDAQVELMPYSRHEPTPNWIFEHSTSRLLISDSGHAFLLDCGYQRVIDAVQDLIDKNLVKQVDGIFVTHYHDDHTDMVQAAAEAFDCPVYATEEYADVLERPADYHLPAMTANPIKNVRRMRDGQRMEWHEFDLRFHFFPGQTLYHGALMASKPGENPVFFIGDAFAPSGLDDYCVLNRNLLHEDSGYLRCLKKLRAVEGEFWLVNEHIQYVFAFSPKELDYLENRYRERIRTLAELFPWDDPNYGVDEQWAVFHPYGTKVAPGATRQLEVRITNHSPRKRTFQVTPRGYNGVEVVEHQATITLAPRQSGSVRVLVRAGQQPGVSLITADVRSEGMEFLNWVEALVSVE